MLRTTPTDAINGLFIGIRTGKTKGKSESWNRVGFFHFLLPLICWNHLQGYFCRFSHCYSDYDHVNPQCNIYHYERIPNWSELFHGSTSLACLATTPLPVNLPRPLPRNSVWINRDRYLAFLNIWRLTDSAGAFDTWVPMFCQKPWKNNYLNLFVIQYSWNIPICSGRNSKS